MLVVSSSSGSSRSGRVSLLESIACSDSDQTCSARQTSIGRRFFRKVTKGADALNNIKNARSASFFDIDEQGSLDILVQRDASGLSRSFTFVKNNYFHDAFFLKALGECLSFLKYILPLTFSMGSLERSLPWQMPATDRRSQIIQCNSLVSSYELRPQLINKQANGVSYSGATYKFTVFDQAGHRRAAAFGQYPQTTYLSLLSPYSFFGLGRTNNYVENLFVGSTRHQLKHYLNIEGVIPNSQVLVEPWQPVDGHSTDTWHKSLYLHPGDWIPGVLTSLIGALVVLGITVAVLHSREAVGFVSSRICCVCLSLT